MSNMFANANVVVTGASGFIGQHLVAALIESGAHVLGYSKTLSPIDGTPSKFMTNQEGEITDLQQLTTVIDNFVQRTGRPVDFFFHLAGQKNAGIAKAHPHETLTASFVGTLNVLEAARKQKTCKRVVLISSLAIYGRSENGTTTELSETQPSSPDSIYSVSKIGAEQMGMAYSKDLSVPVTIARLANVYGPGQSTEAVIPYVIQQAMQNNPALSLGNLEPVRDFIYVKDVVQALMAIAVSPETDAKAINIGTGKGTSIKEVVDIILKNLNYKGQVTSAESKTRANEKSVIVPDTRMLRSLTAWSPKYDIQTGLQKTIEYHSHLRGLGEA